MQMGYWDGNRFVIPGLPEEQKAIIPTAAPVESPVQPVQFQQPAPRPDPYNQAGSGEDTAEPPSPSAGQVGTATGYGAGLGALGTGIGGLTGMAGLGLAGNAIGTGIDAYGVTGDMQRAGMAGPGFDDFLSGMLHNATFGAFGSDINGMPGTTGTQAAHNAHARGVNTNVGGGWMEDDEADRKSGDRQSVVDPNAHARGVNTDPGGGWKEDDEADQDQGADDSVICTELHRQGYETDEFMALDRKFGLRQSPEVMNGYHWWAKPLVRCMRKSRLLTQVVRFVSAPIRQEIAYRMGGNVPFTFLGSIMLDTGRWVCARISVVCNLTRSKNSGLTSRA